MACIILVRKYFIACVSFSNGTQINTVHYDGTVYVWE